MAETSRSRVTITLGGTGRQVVKRVLDNSDPIPLPAVKPSVRDRLGIGISIPNNKRLRGGDNARWNFNHSNCVHDNDLHLSQDDLRFKIMKRTQCNKREKILDLRHLLSRSTCPSTPNPISSYTMHENETRHGSQRVPNPRHLPEPRHDRPEPRPDRPRMTEPIDARQCMPQPGKVTNRVPKLNDVRPHIAERPIASQYTSLTTSEGPTRMGFLGDSYSPWTLDQIRRKSPDRVLNTRGLSPQRRRAYEDSRSVAYGSRDASEIKQHVPPTSFLTKQPLSVGPMKSVGTTPLVAPTLPPGDNVQRSQYPVEHLTVERFLRSLGLEKYLISFKVEEVDMSTLSQMGDQDLKELGIPMGSRKKILLALLARSRRQARWVI